MTHTRHASKQQRFDAAVILLDPPADAYSVGIGYINDLSTYEDGSNSKNGDDNDISNSDGGFEAGADYVLSRAPVQNATTAAGTQNNPKKKEEQQAAAATAAIHVRFVATNISLDKSTLAAKGMDVLLRVDPKTYMHVKNKVSMILKEFAKSRTPDGTYELSFNAEQTDRR